MSQRFRNLVWCRFKWLCQLTALFVVWMLKACTISNMAPASDEPQNTILEIDDMMGTLPLQEWAFITA